MNPVLRIILIVVFFIATALVMGITRSLAKTGAISVMTAVLATGVVGAILGLIFYTKPRPKSQRVDATADTEGAAAFVPVADEEWNILTQYDVEIRAAVKVVRPHGETAVKELREAHRAINDKSQLSKIASEIDDKYRALVAGKRALKSEGKKKAKQKASRVEASTDDVETPDAMFGCWVVVVGLGVGFLVLLAIAWGIG